MDLQTEFANLLARHRTTVGALLEFPKFIQIETVASCNARCVMCPVEQWERSTRVMSDGVYESIVEQLADRAAELAMVCPQLNGEPLIDKKLESRIEQLKRIGVRNVIINCNASLLNKDRAYSLARSGIDEVTFSIDGASSKTFEAIRLRLNFDECIDNIMFFAQERRKYAPNMRIRVRMAVSDLNAHEFNDFLDFWRANLGPGDVAYGKLIHNWANWLDGYSVSGISSDELNAKPCQSLWTSMVILSDGRVPLCCSDFNANAKVGNVTESRLEDIWRNQQMNRYRTEHTREGRKAVGMCVDCNVWDPSSRLDDKI